MNPIRLTQAEVQRTRVAAALACGFALTFATVGTAAEPDSPLLTIDWKARAAAGHLSNGEAVDLTEQRPFAAAHALQVVSPAEPGAAAVDNPAILLTTIENPPLTKQTFALNGWIRHTGVSGTGYLEMWTVFPDGSHYFSRTLDGAGPLQALTGDSDWRRISLPFQLSGDPQAPRPSKLIVNAVLPGAGQITLSDLTLTEADNITAIKPAGAWWNDRTGGWIGGIGGTLIGLIGATIGILMGQGRGRTAVIALLSTMTVLGVVMLLTGIVAVSLGQPYGVWYPLLLGGVLCTGLGTAFLVVTPRRYAQFEMRRMQALDA